MSGVRGEARGLPPDGGYGWVVVGACAASNLIVPPLAAVFGLVLAEACPALGAPAGATALALCLHAGCARLLRAPGAAPRVLRALGPRGAALCGALAAAAGLALTALATAPALLVLCYGLINSVGVALLTSAFTVAMESFFSSRRGVAFGITSSCATLGTVYMPLLVSALATCHGWRHAVLMLAALCLASLISAGLLRPAEWYCKPPPNAQEAALNKDLANGVPDIVAATLTMNGIILAIPSIATLEEELTGDDHRLNETVSLATVACAASIQERNALYQTEIQNTSPERQFSTENKCRVRESQENQLDDRSTAFEMTNLDNLRTIDEVEELPKTTLDKKKHVLDLNKLSQPGLMWSLGVSVGWSAETAFTLVLPLAAGELARLAPAQVALVLAVRGAAHTLYRLLAPSIGEWCHKPPRQMHLIALLMSVFARIMLLLSQSFTSAALAAVALGAAAGLRGRRRGRGGGGARGEERWRPLLDGGGVILLGAATGCARDWCGSWRAPVLGLCAATLAGAAAAAAGAAGGGGGGPRVQLRQPPNGRQETGNSLTIRRLIA